MQVNISIQETDVQMVQAINAVIVKKLNSVVKASLPSIRKRLKEVVKLSLETTVEYNAIAYGKLKAEFGIVNGAGRLDRIIDYFINTISVHFEKIKIIGNSFEGRITIGVIKDDLSGVLSLPEASVITENGHVLNFLRWLLLEGDKVIVKNYTIKNSPKDSRTGTKIMIKNKSKSWSVPPEYSGTKDNNFVTRALENLEDSIDRIVEDEITKRWH